jgi:hypothetical protein
MGDNGDMKDERDIKVGVLLYTYNRVDDARINLEIIRNVWSQNQLLKDVVVVHAFNGEKQWWPAIYLEDELLVLENKGHFEGAEHLLNKGVECFTQKYPDINYVITLASDTWCVVPGYFEKIIREMRSSEKVLAACAWGRKDASDIFSVGMSMDLHILDIQWAVQYGLFPIRYKEFLDKYGEIFFYQNEIVYLERVFALRFKQAVAKAVSIPTDNFLNPIAEGHIRRMTEREPVHSFKRPASRLFRAVHEREVYWPKIGLITHHDPGPKQRIAKEWNLQLGPHGTRFLEAEDFAYFNGGLTGTAYGKQW